jgi:hypothetical protein
MKWKVDFRVDLLRKRKQLINDQKILVKASIEEIQIILSSRITLAEEAAKKQV